VSGPRARSRTMKILLNGEPRDVSADCTVAALVEDLGLRPEQVAVERNRMLVARARRATAQLEEGDELELVTLVGGG
jgi:thiamine biosynthesis protein ThiS